MSTMHDETKTIICKKCGFENSIQSKFCTNCGERVIREDICASCGAELNEGQKFCSECGSKTPKFIALEKAEAERKAREKAEAEGKISVAGIEMVRIPDNAIHKGLYFGKYQVTQAQWQSIMGNNPSYFTGDSSRPVEQVSWNDCQEFIKKLNARAEVKSAGITFRLPTGKEWVYACCAGSTGEYGLLANGREGKLDEMGWYKDNSGRMTHPVGQKRPNAWGLYDMHGNVYEWTALADGSHRIGYGGSCYDDASNCESGSGFLDGRRDRHDYLGFRLAASRTTPEHKVPMKTVAGIEMVLIPDNTTHKGLYFGKYQVTQAQWQAIMGNNPSEFTGDSSRPVEQVSWNDCQEFIKKLNARTEVKQAGLTFFLPTSEQWEYACRAGSKGKYGLLADGREGSLYEMGWYWDNSEDETHPVGHLKPNAWGLYDMHGNVWEWTASADGSYRICRGGDYDVSASNCESGFRRCRVPEFRLDNLGFRLAASRTTQVLETEYKVPVKTEVELKVSKKAELEREIFVAGIEMVRIPDSSTYKGLYFGKYQVTQAQWQAIMGNNPSEFTGDSSRPVENVSWDDCLEFIKKLNARADVKQAGITFRLPTEEEWEYACRAGSTGKYGLLANGREGKLDEMGWYRDNSGDETHPVGQKKPNAWGLYDMHGNVDEWTASADFGPILIGGSYLGYASNCESGSMDWNKPEYSDDSLGFRLAASRTVY